MPLPFNWKHIAGQAWRSIAGTRGTHRRLTGKRIRVLLVFWAIFIPHQLITRFFLLLDNLIFPGWRKTLVDKPIFITGLFRSGTTYLHRLLAGSDDRFAAFRTWEIYLAPSIIQRRLLRLWKHLDRMVGSPAMNWLLRYNDRNLGKVRFHQVGLWKEEEDEGLLLFAWDSLFTWFFFPDSGGMDDYIYADREMSPRRRRRKWRFYRNCVMRHMYAHPGTSIYLSKNPAFTSKLSGLKEAFPDARIVYLLREPHRVLVSQAAWFSFVWHYFASPVEAYPFTGELMEMTRHWYDYPLKFLRALPADEYAIVPYQQLTGQPEETVKRLFDRFGLEMSESLENHLSGEHGPVSEYASAGRLSVDEVGYDEADIRERFSDIFELLESGESMD